VARRLKLECRLPKQDAEVRRVVRSARAGVSLLPLVMRRPVLARRWLAGAHAAQLGLLLFLLAVPIGLPAALDPLLERLYPPIQTTRKLLGGVIALPSTREDPRREARRIQVLAVGWSAGLAGVALLFLAALPRSVARASAESRAQESRAVQLGGAQPREGLRLYRAALALAGEPAREAQLAEKIRKAESLLRQAAGADPAATAIEAFAPELDADPGSGTAPPRYAIEHELGRGAMGIVYRARDTVLDRNVALKELPLHLAGRSELARRFRQEARLLARLVHPNIVQVYDLIEQDRRLWIAMELVDGGTLADAIERAGRMPWREALPRAQQIAAALAFAHGQGVIHRDVKPVNILLGRDGRTAKLTDFGLARLLESSVHTSQGSLLGSARYMSPEQAAGRAADARADVYAFGVSVYEMLAGRAPFEGETRAVLAQHLSQAPPPLASLAPELPAALAALVMQMLEKEPERRPQDLAAVADRLAVLGTAPG
jgi:hypothetical protein